GPARSRPRSAGLGGRWGGERANDLAGQREAEAARGGGGDPEGARPAPPTGTGLTQPADPTSSDGSDAAGPHGRLPPRAASRLRARRRRPRGAHGRLRAVDRARVLRPPALAPLPLPLRRSRQRDLRAHLRAAGVLPDAHRGGAARRARSRDPPHGGGADARRAGLG